MNKHTPGPWEVGTYNMGPTIFDSRGNGTVPIASVHDTVVEDVECNARLIAAAPDLYEAAVAVLRAFELYGHFDKTDRLLRAAVRKVEECSTD